MRYPIVMIKQLRLKNYILIDELEANFHSGLNVITGETGAGKSILISAIDLAFSARVSKDVIKNGCDKAVIELVIENTKHNLKPLFEENGIDDYGVEIILTKEITQNGVRTRLNGTLINQDFLKQIKALFLDIHSQHQTYVFMQPKYHITLLDNYAKDVYGKTLEEYRELYKKYLDTKNLLEQAKNSADNTESQIEFLKFQVNEIEEAEIKGSNEDEELNQELEVLANAEKLKELTGQAYWAINGDDGSIIEALGKIKQSISKAAGMDSKLEDLESRLIDITENLHDAGSELRDYSQNLDNDTERLNEIQERLYLLDKLKRKYGSTLEEVLQTHDKLAAELAGIEFSSQNVELLEKEVSELYNKLEDIASHISENRKNYAKVLSVYIQEKLEKLELPKARFEISVSEKELAKYHQIILITHQPIIASKADKHFYVRKSQADETKVEVYVLQGDNKIKALAELAGGEINEQSIEFAKSLIEA